MSDELRLPETQRSDRSRAVTWSNVPSHVTPSQVQQLVFTFQVVEASFEAQQGSTLILAAQACSTPPGSEDGGDQDKVAGKRMQANHGMMLVVT